MRRSRVLVGAALAAVVALPNVGHASGAALPADSPLYLTDPAGDATGLPAVTPAPIQRAVPSHPGADLTSLKFFRLDDGSQVTGQAISFSLAGAPGQAFEYDLAMDVDVYTGTCFVTSLFALHLVVTMFPHPSGTLEAECMNADETTASLNLPVQVIVSGQRITWVIGTHDPAWPYLQTGAIISNPLLRSTTVARAATSAAPAVAGVDHNGLEVAIDTLKPAFPVSYTVGQ